MKRCRFEDIDIRQCCEWPVNIEFVLSEPCARIASELNVPIQAAAGLRALLYSWAAKHAVEADGNISAFRVKTIEDACLWDGDRGVLCMAFRSAGVLSGDPDDDTNPLAIVNWSTLVSDAFDLIQGIADDNEE